MREPEVLSKVPVGPRILGILFFDNQLAEFLNCRGVTSVQTLHFLVLVKA